MRRRTTTPTPAAKKAACGLRFSHCSPRSDWSTADSQIGKARSFTMLPRRDRWWKAFIAQLLALRTLQGAREVSTSMTIAGEFHNCHRGGHADYQARNFAIEIVHLSCCMIYGYARVSTDGQSVDTQLTPLDLGFELGREFLRIEFGARRQ